MSEFRPQRPEDVIRRGIDLCPYDGGRLDNDEERVVVAAHNALDVLLADLQEAKDGRLAHVTSLADEVRELRAERDRYREGLVIAGDALIPLGEWLIEDGPAMPLEVVKPMIEWCKRADEFMALAAGRDPAPPAASEA